MRILHTSDWHLGRTTGGESRREDHEAAVADVLAAARDFAPHLVLHTGDLFDVLRPGVDDMRFALDALRRLAETAPVLVLAGNHDSPALFDFLGDLLGPESRLRFAGEVRHPRQGGILDYPGEGAERCRVCAFPFVHANRLCHALEHDPALRTAAYADRVHRMQQGFRAVLEEDRDPARDVLVFAAHLHVEGAVPSGSERAFHVSDSYASRVGELTAMNYAAFGHIHKPQDVPGLPFGRYAGSPLPLDFGETRDEKGLFLVQATPGRATRIERVPLESGRRLSVLEGTREQLEAMAPEAGRSLLRLVVHTEEVTPGLSDWAREAFPQARVLEVRELCSRSQVKLVEDSAPTGEQETVPQAFKAWLAEQPPGDVDATQVEALFSALLEAPGEEDLPEAADLRRVLVP